MSIVLEKPNVRYRIRTVRSLQQKKEKTERQNRIETAIVEYQKSLQLGNKLKTNRCYDAICSLYQPLEYSRVWYTKYQHLYDTKEDFTQDYLRIFCTCLGKWQPRSIRKESKWGGSGKFENFFWSALNNSYINMVKQESSAKRNVSSKCPACNNWATPLSSHLLNKHEDLLWKYMEQFDLDIQCLTACPFCKSHRVTKPTSCTHSVKTSCEACAFEYSNKKLKKHLLSMHSGFLFEQFRIDYPNYITISSKPVSVMFECADETEDISIYDAIPADTTVDSILAYDLSPIQRQMVEKVLNGSLNLKYDGKLYNCSLEEYQNELELLQQILILCGIPSRFGD